MRKSILLSIFVTFLGISACDDATGSSGNSSSADATSSSVTGLWSHSGRDSGSAGINAYTEYLSLASNGTFLRKSYEAHTGKVGTKDSTELDSGSTTGAWMFASGKIYMANSGGTIDTADVSFRDGKLVAVFHGTENGKPILDTVTYTAATSIVAPASFKKPVSTDTTKTPISDTAKSDSNANAASVTGLWVHSDRDSGSAGIEAYTEYIDFVSNGTFLSTYFEARTRKVGTKDSTELDSGSTTGTWKFSAGKVYTANADGTIDTADVSFRDGKLVAIFHGSENGKPILDTVTYAAATSIVAPAYFKKTVSTDTTKTPVIDTSTSSPDTSLLGTWKTSTKEESTTYTTYVTFSPNGKFVSKFYLYEPSLDSQSVTGTWFVSGNRIIIVQTGVEVDYADTSTFTIRNGVLTMIDSYTDEGERYTDTTVFTRASAIVPPTSAAARTTTALKAPSLTALLPWPLRKRSNP